MIHNNIHIALTILLTIALVACRADRAQEPAQTLTIPLTLCMPTAELQNSNVHKIMGDPGTTEQFELPKYAYIFVLMYINNQWKIYQINNETIEPQEWVKTHYTGAYNSLQDSIYQYSKKYDILLANIKTEGRVYAIASNKPLIFTTTITTSSTLDDLLELKFETESDEIQQNLQNIYSTPYNYDFNGNYYGSFNSANAKVPVVNLLLYHVASKVDLKWFVSEDVRINTDDPSSAVRLTYLEVRNLFNQPAYAFRPNENKLSVLPTTGYEIPNIVTNTTEALWWEGRKYFYTIPFTVSSNSGYYPLQMLLKTNESTGSGYRLTLNQPFDTDSPFVPWIRGTITLTQPLEDISETKTAE